MVALGRRCTPDSIHLAPYFPLFNVGYALIIDCEFPTEEELCFSISDVINSFVRQSTFVVMTPSSKWRRIAYEGAKVVVGPPVVTEGRRVQLFSSLSFLDASRRNVCFVGPQRDKQGNEMRERKTI